MVNVFLTVPKIEHNLVALESCQVGNKMLTNNYHQLIKHFIANYFSSISLRVRIQHLYSYFNVGEGGKEKVDVLSACCTFQNFLAMEISGK